MSFLTPLFSISGSVFKNFLRAIASGFKNATNFLGRASRSDLLYWVLFLFLLQRLALFVDGPKGVGFFGLVTNLILFIPGCALVARRLHDCGKSGWWQLVSVIGPCLVSVIMRMHDFGHSIPTPLLILNYVGVLPLIYWCCQKGDSVYNIYGPPPAA